MMKKQNFMFCDEKKKKKLGKIHLLNFPFSNSQNYPSNRHPAQPITVTLTGTQSSQPASLHSPAPQFPENRLPGGKFIAQTGFQPPLLPPPQSFTLCTCV